MPDADLNRRPTLLIADDEPTNLQVLRQILQADYRLLFAKDGAKAVELAHSEKPDLILLDVMMPNMTGHDACRALKADPRTSDIPVIFVTIHGSVEEETACWDAGAARCAPGSPAVASTAAPICSPAGQAPGRGSTS